MRTAAIAVLTCVLLVLGVWKLLPEKQPAGRRILRVCADPNNLPFSNERGEGFENRLAGLVAGELAADLEYVWWAQRRGYIRNTINAGACDVWMGVPSRLDLLLVTAPYYRSTYVFVYPRSAGFKVDSLDAPELRKLTVGVQIVGDDYANAPPAHALSSRGIIRNVRGYSVIGNYSEPNPPSRIIEAVASGEIDIAMAWGPMAGFFAQRQRVPMAVVPVSPQVDRSFLPFVYEISMGVARGNKALKSELERTLSRRRKEVRKILDEYHVPQLSLEGL